VYIYTYIWGIYNLLLQLPAPLRLERREAVDQLELGLALRLLEGVGFIT
jgi:hypothetical protein